MSGDRALFTFLSMRFDNKSLRRLLKMEFGDKLVNALPGVESSRAEYSFAVVEALQMRGLVTEKLFKALAGAREGRGPEIVAIAIEFGITIELKELEGRGAASMAALSWLHVSDFHFGGKGPHRARVVFDTLVEKVKNEKRSLDLIIASGDIAFSGQPEQYETATEVFDRLLAAGGLEGKRERLIVVPGNHDVDRGLGRFLQRTLKDTIESDDYFGTNHPKYHFDKFRAYRAWYDKYFEGIRTAPSSTTCGPSLHLDVNGTRVAVLPINTALFSLGDDDKEKLWIGASEVRKALSDIEEQPADLRIAVMHHPLDWIAYGERGFVRERLRRVFHMILQGHMHDPDVELINSIEGVVLRLSAGASYQGRTYSNQVTLGRLEGKTVTIRALKYDESRQRWALDTVLFPEPPFEGVFTLK